MQRCKGFGVLLTYNLKGRDFRNPIYIAALIGLAYYFYLGLGFAISSLTYAINLGRSILTKYSNYCVRSTYRFTLSFSPA
jgi:hypothetical protein